MGVEASTSPVDAVWGCLKLDRPAEEMLAGMRCRPRA
jgi:hypothetical protein